MTDSPEHPQLERGMRLRGLAMTRLETFVDAAFAFAVTLLVISVDDVPRSFEELVLALKNIPVFLAASAQLFLFWIAHRSWSRVYGLDDGVTVVLTLLLVASLLVMVFPLRIVYSFGAADITDGWIPAPFELDAATWGDQLRLMFVMLGASWAWLAGVVVAMFAYALRQGDALDLNDAERANASMYMRNFGLLACSGLLSIALASTMPDHLVPLAGYQYFLLILLPFFARALPSHRGGRKMQPRPMSD